MDPPAASSGWFPLGPPALSGLPDAETEELLACRRQNSGGPEGLWGYRRAGALHVHSQADGSETRQPEPRPRQHPVNVLSAASYRQQHEARREGPPSAPSNANREGLTGSQGALGSGGGCASSLGEGGGPVGGCSEIFYPPPPIKNNYF